jgi:hypothetical protein
VLDGVEDIAICPLDPRDVVLTAMQAIVKAYERQPIVAENPRAFERVRKEHNERECISLAGRRLSGNG